MMVLLILAVFAVIGLGALIIGPKIWCTVMQRVCNYNGDEVGSRYYRELSNWFYDESDVTPPMPVLLNGKIYYKKDSLTMIDGNGNSYDSEGNPV